MGFFIYRDRCFRNSGMITPLSLVLFDSISLCYLPIPSVGTWRVSIERSCDVFEPTAASIGSNGRIDRFCSGRGLFHCGRSQRGEFRCPTPSFCYRKQLISALNLRRCFLQRRAGKNRCKTMLLCLDSRCGSAIDR